MAQVLRDARRRRARLLPARRLASTRHKHYAQAAIDAGVGVRELHAGVHRERPGRVGQASSPTPGLPIVGDDIKSQVGATITHRVLAKLFEDRGVKLDRTYQLNFGGNMDFMNMLERERLTSKKISKTQSVQSQLRQQLRQGEHPHRAVGPRAVARGPQVGADPPGGRRRSATCPSSIELKLEVWDSPELGRHRDRRRPLREARDGPRDRRPAHRPERLLHEVARRCSSPTTPRARWSRSSRTGTPRSRSSTALSAPASKRSSGSAGRGGGRTRPYAPRP